MFPLIDFLGFGSPTNFVLAFVLGIVFGFVLERAGFGNSKKLAMQFYFRDLTVLKVMFTAIITAMTGLIVLDYFGWLDLTLVNINPTYLWPGLVGGLIMGAGFIIGGFCPGTALVGASTLKIDALFYLLGALLGMALFAELMPNDAFFDFYGLQTDGFSGNLTLPVWLGLRPGIVGGAIILMALGAFVASEWAEKRFSQKVDATST